MSETDNTRVKTKRDWYVMQQKKIGERGCVTTKEDEFPPGETFALLSSCMMKSYENLPLELQFDITERICPFSRSSFSLVNRHAYALTLPQRYRSIQLPSPRVAQMFSRHYLHAKFNNPAYVRNISVTLPSTLSSMELAVLRNAVQHVPKEVLETFSAQIHQDATYAARGMSELLGPVTNIRKLSISCPNDSTFGFFERVQFPYLEHLVFQTAHQVLSTEQCAHFLKDALQRTAHSMKHLDLRCAEASISGCSSSHQSPFRGYLSAPFEVVPLQLESVTFRNINLAKVISFDWNLLGKDSLSALRFFYCSGLGFILGNLARVTATWSCLRNLTLVLTDMQIQHNTATIQLLDEILCSLPCSSLKHLRVEIPAVERLPNAHCIARHLQLESLIIAITNLDGRWLCLNPNDMKVIVRRCTLLQCLGLTFPPLGECSRFINSLMFASVSALLVIGLEESSPHASAPGWVRHCPHRDDNEENESRKLATTELIFVTMGAASESEKEMTTLAVGLHIGAYYCSQWMREMTFYLRGCNNIPRRVSQGDILLEKALEDVLENCTV